MRLRLGMVVTLSLVTVAVLIGAGASAQETPTTSDTVASTVPETTVPDTTVPETTVPAADELATATGTSQRRIDAGEPGAAGAPAERVGEAIQLTDPPPAPTTTTLPPIDQLPADSGEGRRIVYSKTNQWVWLVEADGEVVRDFAVSGRRTWNQPLPGEYHIFSRSERTWSRASGGSVTMRFMMRFTVGPGGDNIGFHEIPTRGGRPLQSDGQLGEPLSAGCVRLSTDDIVFLWHWAPNHTKVVVLP